MKLGILFLLITSGFFSACASTAKWDQKHARDWSAEKPWLVGSNYIPSDASNELEMWQAASFDPVTIDRELGWAENTGFTTVRVFLHDLAYSQDPSGFIKRVDTFLGIAAKHHILPMLVIFDSCWDPNPKVGPQPAPRKGVHNSRWVQSPGLPALKNPSEYPRLEAYVKGIVHAFAKDPRILAWDVWNEPDNRNDSSYADPTEKLTYVATLLPQVFAWVRSQNPSQPLTSGVWAGDWASNKLTTIQHIQLESSDVISFHSYDPPEKFESRIAELQSYNRPLLCTEYMARPLGSTLESILPIAKAHQVAAMNWGFVAGKSQTNFPWDSWEHAYAKDPPVWFHDLYHADGKPYRASEISFLQKITAKP